METKEFICHDLKSDRPEVSKGLPPVFRLVPVAFYLAAIAAIALGTWFALQYRTAQDSKEAAMAELADLRMENERLEAEKKDIEKRNSRSQEVVTWMQGAQALQPLSVAITRSLASSVTLSELTLMRNAELPDQLHFTLKLDGGGPDQMEQTLSSVRALNFQDYSAQQVKTNDLIDYKATLIWKNPN